VALRTLLANNVGEDIGPDLMQILLAHLTPLERCAIEGIERGLVFYQVAQELHLSERRCREMYEGAVKWLCILAAEAITQNGYSVVKGLGGLGTAFLGRLGPNHSSKGGLNE